MRIPSKNTKFAILKVLNDAGKPMGGALIEAALQSMGVDIRPRTIRAYLLQLDEQGFTELVDRRWGRQITERGRQELLHANVVEKVGIIAAKVDNLGYRMSFRSKAGSGTVVVNICFIKTGDLSCAVKEIESAFAKDLTMASKVIIAREGELLGNTVVPENYVAICTVCSVSMNGILLHESIPVNSRFGGLLEVKDSKPVRFLELIEYKGSTLDPFEIFIKAEMTSVRNLIEKGSGVICVSFREVPSIAVSDIRRIERDMKKNGMGGILTIGRPNQPLFDIPVSQGYSGMLVVGGLNPIAAVHEAGIKTDIRSLAELRDFREFSTIEELRRMGKIND